MKRLVAIILSVLLMMTALSGMSVAMADGGKTLKVLQPIWNNFDPSNTPVHQEFLKKLNEYMGEDINLEFTYYASGDEYNQKLNMAINTADMPWDIIYLTGLSGGDGTYQGSSSLVNGYGQDGYFLNLKEYEEQMPNVWGLIEACGTLFNYMYDANGDLYFIPAFTESQGGTLNAGRRGPIIDATAFDEAGIAYPTSLEELYQAAKKFKELYPDSNPIAPMSTGAKAVCSRLDEMAFATRWAGNLGFDGTEYVVEATTDKFRNMMIFGNKLVAEGLVAADYSAWDGDMYTAATKNGKSFIFLNMWSSIKADGTLNSTTYGIEGHKYINIAYAMAMNDGGWWEMRGSMKDISAVPSPQLVINANTADVDLAVKVVDYLYTEECRNLMYMGIQGTSWDYDENGSKVFINEYLNATGTTSEENPRVALGLHANSVASGILTGFNVTNTKGLGEETYMPFLMPDGTVELENPYLFGQKYWTYENMEPENSVDTALPSVTAEEYEEVNEISTVMNTYIQESMAKFYQGEWDPNDDAAWNAFVEQVKAYGSDRLCEIYNAYIVGVDFYND